MSQITKRFGKLKKFSFREKNKPQQNNLCRNDTKVSETLNSYFKEAV